MNTIESIAAAAQDRIELWTQIVKDSNARAVAEVGVWKGEFAEELLTECEAISTYYMLDPWRNLADWNKPYNVSNDKFWAVMQEAMARTEFAAQKRVVLRGETKDVAAQIPDASLDLCYIDGDHTLRGILIDLMKLYPKVKDGGLLGGDDMTPYAWVHGRKFEPTLVFPTVVHFAEATGSVIYALPFGQFAMRVDRTQNTFAYHDLTGRFGDTSVRRAMKPRVKHDLVRGLKNAWRGR
jgi:hypothetical protein